MFVLLMVFARDWSENRVWRTSEETVERIVYDVVRGEDGDILATRPGETPLVQVVSNAERHAASRIDLTVALFLRS